MLGALSRLVPALLRHLDAYGQIAAEDARDLTTSIGACLRLALMAFAGALLAAIMACAWLMLLAWDQPWRAWVPAGLAILLALASYSCVRSVRRRQPGLATLFARVRGEWRRDREVVERALRRPENEEGARPDPAPEGLHERPRRERRRTAA